MTALSKIISIFMNSRILSYSSYDDAGIQVKLRRHYTITLIFIDPLYYTRSIILYSTLIVLHHPNGSCQGSAVMGWHMIEGLRSKGLSGNACCGLNGGRGVFNTITAILAFCGDNTI